MEDTKEYSEQVTNIKKVKTEYQYREDGEPGTMQELLLNEQEEKIFTQMQGKIYGYSNLMMMFRCAIREVRTKLEVLDDEFSVRYKRNPITKIQSLSLIHISGLLYCGKYGDDSDVYLLINMQIPFFSSLAVSTSRRHTPPV